jgi:hypothetical protein
MRHAVNQIFFFLLSVALLLQSSTGASSLEGCVAVSTTSSGTELKIITPNGFVAFSVGNGWPVIAIRPKLPVAAAGFQIPNAADENISASTNLAISLYDETTTKGT